MAARTFNVPGISCGHCKNAIEGEVGSLEGVSSVDVDIDTKQVTVDGSADDTQIREAIEEAGYEVAPA